MAQIKDGWFEGQNKRLFDGLTDGWTDGWTDGRIDGWIDAWMDGWMVRRMCLGGWTGREKEGKIEKDSWMDGPMGLINDRGIYGCTKRDRKWYLQCKVVCDA